MKNYVRTSVKPYYPKQPDFAAIKRDALSQYAVLPGGGQHKGETFLKRCAVNA
jgi:hypothetical protein